MSTHLVSRIDVKDFGAEQLRVGDLNGDGAPDLLFIQSVYETREITCLTATDLSGNVLWQVGTPSLDNGRIYSDLPVQVYDWDGDGENEVLCVSQAVYAEVSSDFWARERAARYEGEATVHVLAGTTGEEKESFPIPTPADDSFLFADLTGRGRRADLVVKDRYWTMWGISHEGEVLWKWEGSPGHFPAVADVDGDGRDEVFVGFALIDHDGTILFEKDPVDAHQDAAYIARLDDGTWRLFFVNSGLHCLTESGAELWHHPLGHAQHVIVDRFRDDSEQQVAVINRARPDVLYLYDLDGREIWSREQPQAKGEYYAALVEIDWFGGGAPKGLMVYGRGADEPVAVFDGAGEIVDTFEMAYTPDRTDEDRRAYYYCARADLWGDGRDEAILFGTRGACIYANARPLALPTLYNSTLYPGM